MGDKRRGNPTPPMGQVSAAQELWGWITQHGREPRLSECNPSHGLRWFQTYYKVFNLRSFRGEILPLVSALMSSTKIRQCLGHQCSATFENMGNHIRFCHRCREKQRETDEGEYMIVMGLPSLTLRELGAGQGGWQMYDSWVQDVDWSNGVVPQKKKTRED